MAKRRRKSIILRLTLLAFSIYTIISMSQMEMELVEARRQLTDIENQKTEQELKNQELLQLLENGSEKDFIERAARDRLGYVYADEKVYTDMSGMAGS
ncbi:MAG TPA: septum formation initiator family protein [Firmicutes bacterium]|nr:septum formation initiator family protein [Bacillota bacterium]